MPTWTWWDYVDDNDESIVKKWLCAFSEKVATKIKSKFVTVTTYAEIERKLSDSRFEKLEHPYDDLIRLTIKVNNVPYKIFVCYGVGRRSEIWLLACGKEHNNNYRPPEILNTARHRRDDILSGRNQVRATCLLEKN